MLLLALISFFVSMISVLIISRWLRHHAVDHAQDIPQRFHLGVVPRLGGLGMLMGWCVAFTLAFFEPLFGIKSLFNYSPLELLAWFAIIIGLVITGALEDLTQRVPVLVRLSVTAFAGLIAVFWLEVSVPRIGISWIDVWWIKVTWPSVLLAVLAIAGLPHAFNIIDGYNGLASSVAMIVGLALTYVSLKVGDGELATISLIMVASTLGFFIWNYPRGIIFAGDCGAYFWGVIISLISVQLVQRHPDVSPWFPVLLLIYPVWETIFSIYRKVSRGVSPGMADALHLHQLVYRRIVKAVLEEDEVRVLLVRNNRTTPYLFGLTFLTVLPAVIFWSETWFLLCFSLLFVITYVTGYLTLIRFKVPEWLRSK